MLVAYGTVQAYDPLGLYLLMVALMGMFLDLSNTLCSLSVLQVRSLLHEYNITLPVC